MNSFFHFSWAAANDIRRAHAAGIEYVDVYLFPNTDQDAGEQTRNTIQNLLNDGVLTNNMVWMDVEGPGYWTSDCGTNANFLRTMIATVDSMYKGSAAVSSHPHKSSCGRSTCVGIYSSASQWNPIMCGDGSFGGYDLWYAHYDDDDTFNDFSPFGGWGHPAIKQFEGTTGICGTSIDMDAY
jgi:GH25 family lysozyme M1 (1,4-beta-N-acetylmuramidase)